MIDSLLRSRYKDRHATLLPDNVPNNGCEGDCMIERLPVRAAILPFHMYRGAAPKVDLTLMIIQDGHP